MWKLFNFLNVQKPATPAGSDSPCPTDSDRLGDDVSFDDAMHFHFVGGTSLLVFPDGTKIGEWPIDGAPVVVADDVR